jgi:hypothetical protein
MFAHLDLNDLKSLHELFLTLDIDLENFLEYICCLKNIKPAYKSHKDISKFYDVIIFIKDIDISKFVYFKHLKLLCNKNKVIEILKKYNKDLSYLENITSNYFQNEDSIIIGDILGYFCPGLTNRTRDNSVAVSYYIKLSTDFKRIFNTDKNYLQIIGFNCLNSDLNSKFLDFYLYENLLNNYFKTINIGNVFINFKRLK